MRKFCSSVLLATSLCILGSINYSLPIFAQENPTISEEAQNLYEDALSLLKKGKKSEAIASYIKALRKDRTILALDDNAKIPAANEYQCGSCDLHSLSDAKAIAKEILDKGIVVVKNEDIALAPEKLKDLA